MKLNKAKVIESLVVYLTIVLVIVAIAGMTQAIMERSARWFFGTLTACNIFAVGIIFLDAMEVDGDPK